MCLGESNRHIVRRIVGLGGVHGGYSVGQTNVEGRMLLEFCLAKELCVSNICVKYVFRIHGLGEWNRER